jgi:hypothetical protein
MSLKVRDYIPAMKYGAKIYPEDIAGMIGLPHVGNVYYVDPVLGSDSAGGMSMTDAFATLTAAYNAVTTNNHDVIVLAPSGPGAGAQPYATTETAAITWSKNLVHLVGNVAPIMTSPRARVSTATASLSPFITISGQGNSFHNVMFLSNATTDYITVRVSGNRNSFFNCHFANINDTALNSASFRHLELYGGQENYFASCTIGTDTVTATAAGANLGLTLGADTVARNTFDGCIFPMMADADAPLFIKQADSVGMDRWNLFRGCQFINAIGSTSTQQTDAMAVHATPGGLLVLQDCLKIGATGWANNLTNVYLLGASSNSTYNQGIGFAVNPAA